MVFEGMAHFVEVSSGRDDTVPCLQCRLSNSGADTATITCDEPNFVHSPILSMR